MLGEDDIDPALLAEVTDQATGVVSAHLLALTQAGLMTMTDDEPARHRFTHSLIRHGIARQAAPSAAELHRHAAAALERTVGTNPAQAARIAEHWRRAGFDTEALHATVRWKRAAATHALTNQAPQIAARLLDQARASQDRARGGAGRPGRTAHRARDRRSPGRADPVQRPALRRGCRRRRFRRSARSAHRGRARDPGRR